jgi:hypothetical protein
MKTIGIIFAVLLTLLLYGGSNFYIWKRLLQGLGYIFPHMSATVYSAIALFLALSIFMAILPLPTGLKGILRWISSYWMGIYVYLLILFLLADLMLFLGGMIQILPVPVPQSLRFGLSLLVVGLTAGLVVYGVGQANRIEKVSYDIQLKKTGSSDGLNIVLISDLHLGAVDSEKRLPKIIELINREKPDLVCIAGDLFDDDYFAIHDPEKAVGLLKSITATYGVYACLGNHDGGKTFNEMQWFLEQSNIRLLKDEYEIIDGRLALFGRVDPMPIGGFGGLERKDIAARAANIDPNLPVVVMDHTPSNLEQYGKAIDLVLAGHTHKGQIFPFNWITNAMFTANYGHYQKDADSPHFIVTSGASTWGMPMRIGTKSEVVRIRLH